MASFKAITNANCNALPYLYAAAKKAYGFTVLDSSTVSEFGGLAGKIKIY